MGLHDAVAVFQQDPIDRLGYFRTHVLKGGTDRWIERTDVWRQVCRWWCILRRARSFALPAIL